MFLFLYSFTSSRKGKSTCRFTFPSELYIDETSNSKAELQIQGSTTAQISFETHSSANELVCRDWKAGTCRRGNKCRYRHGDGVSHIHLVISTSAPLTEMIVESLPEKGFKSKTVLVLQLLAHSIKEQGYIRTQNRRTSKSTAQTMLMIQGLSHLAALWASRGKNQH